MRALVVEDSRSLADGIAEGLKDHGMAVDVAYDGLEAVAKLDVNAYDVVILDRDLPDCTATPSAGPSPTAASRSWCSCRPRPALLASASAD
jgi:CheY-like chemotaxis protein